MFFFSFFFIAPLKIPTRYKHQTGLFLLFLLRSGDDLMDGLDESQSSDINSTAFTSGCQVILLSVSRCHIQQVNADRALVVYWCVRMSPKWSMVLAGSKICNISDSRYLQPPHCPEWWWSVTNQLQQECICLFESS